MNKSAKLGIVIWLLALINLATLIPNIGNMSWSNTLEVVQYIVSPIIGFILMIILGITVMRGVNDKMTLVVVIIFAIVNLSIPTGVLVVLLLVRRFAKNRDATQKFWFLPGIAQAIAVVISVITNHLFSYGALTIITYLISYISSTILLFILGYWLLKLLKYETAADATVSYYDDLLARGVISAEEYENKTASLKKANDDGGK